MVGGIFAARLALGYTVPLMKLVTYVQGKILRGGILAGDTILDMEHGFAVLDAEAGRSREPGSVRARHGEGVLGFIEHEDVARPAAEELVARHAKRHFTAPIAVPVAGSALASPLPRPPSMRDGYAFRQHVETARKNRGLEMIPEFDQFPVFYFTNHQAVIGPGDVHVQKLHMDRLDFELEAAIVVGKRARNVTAANADAIVFGYTIMNDLSARGLQMEEMKLSLGPAKGKDFATALGPVLVTRDELAAKAMATPKGEHHDMTMRAFVNGVQVSQGNLKDMTWTFAQILERASYGVTLYPGDVVGSGTCGTGCFLELNGSKITNNQWLHPGDVVALEIDGLGRLENRIVVDDETTGPSMRPGPSLRPGAT
jgi:fumarylacetoacetate (FAA) hydrolase